MLDSPDNDGISVTRLYIIVLCVTLTIVIFFTSFGQQVHTITVLSPNESTFSDLHHQQSTTFSCSCSQVSIRHDAFLSILPRLHQVCSSGFVTANWWDYLWGTDAESNYRDLQLLSAQFRLLSSLCSLAQQTINEMTSQFFSDNLVSVEVLPPGAFHDQVDSLIATFIAQTPAKFRRVQSFIRDTFHSNQLMNVFGTSWALTFTNANENYVLATIPRGPFDGNCSCVSSLNSCSRPLYIDKYYNKNILPGVVAGCLPIDGVRLSTLECFFDSNCILNLTSIASKRTTTIWIADPLNVSIPSIFAPNTLVGTLIDALFIEDWPNTSNYSSYFASCAPHSCSYNYVERNTALYIITTVLGLYGGLTVVLRFSVWHGWRMYRMGVQWIRTIRRSSSTRVVPVDSTIS